PITRAPTRPHSPAHPYRPCPPPTPETASPAPPASARKRCPPASGRAACWFCSGASRPFPVSRVKLRLLSRLASRLREEQGQQTQFDRAETDFDPVRNERFVILGEKRFHKTGPDQHDAHAKNQRHQIA